MEYSEFAIEQLKNKLSELSFKDSTPRKYAVVMFEAFEVIKQLQKQKSPLQSGNSNKGQQ
ncbi:MAG: hypothetical protein ACLUKQ_03650 [Peptococcaceae bacterium]